MKNIIVRSLSGAVYVALLVAAILLRQVYTEWIFLAVFSLFIALGIHEVHHLAYREGKRKRSPLRLQLLDIAGGIGLFGGVYMHYYGYGSTALWLLPVVVYFILRTIVQLYMPSHDAMSLMSRSALSLVYVAMPIALINPVVCMSNPRMLLVIFIFIWTFDTGAFVIGSAIGRHRLFERISPKKSWEGVVGGIVCSLGAGWLLYTYCNDFFQGPLQLEFWLVMAGVVGVFATFGDLFESLLKRTVGVKDSGNLIPGHGGILDRIDSLLLVIPAMLVFLYCYQFYLQN